MLTFTVRLADPAADVQGRSSRCSGSQTLQPEIKKLQERYKDDKQRMNQEMMSSTSENKVNPFASCLPLVAAAAGLHLAVLQLAATRREFKADIAGERRSFFFITNLPEQGRPDPVLWSS